jgi:hypothetical protein
MKIDGHDKPPELKTGFGKKSNSFVGIWTF